MINFLCSERKPPSSLSYRLGSGFKMVSDEITLCKDDSLRSEK